MVVSMALPANGQQMDKVHYICLPKNVLVDPC